MKVPTPSVQQDIAKLVLNYFGELMIFALVMQLESTSTYKHL